MTTGRLEAFSDGVLAIVITIMVLEVEVPAGTTLEAWVPTIPLLLGYALSFLHVAMYWCNHHHLFQAAGTVNARVMWANVHLLFWVSLIPATTGWLGQSGFEPWPVALYGTVLLCAGLAYLVLARTLVSHHGEGSVLDRALSARRKGTLSLALYLVAIPMSFVVPIVACGIYVVVACLWVVPEGRIASLLTTEQP